MTVYLGLLVSVSVCVAFDYSFDHEPPSKYDEEIFERDSNADTMELMDGLKEELDASFTPLSDMTFSGLRVPLQKENSTRTTEMDPHDYIRRKRSTTAVVPDQKPKIRRKGHIGRPRKTTLFPMTTSLAGVWKKRIKWDDKMNKFIMYNYYYLTKMETDMEQWRQKMREKFLEVYPNLDSISEQRLSDQKRSITQNLLIDRKSLVEIKRAARKQLEEEGVITVVPVEDAKEKSFYD